MKIHKHDSVTTFVCKNKLLHGIQYKYARYSFFMSELNGTVCLELDGLEMGWQVGPIPVEDGYGTLYSLRRRSCLANSGLAVQSRQ